MLPADWNHCIRLHCSACMRTLAALVLQDLRLVVQALVFVAWPPLTMLLLL
jgi:hypothetical protein